jgi:predicted O-methyltransferase YrrM
VRELNRKISTDDRVDHVVLPIADGVTLLRRKS